MQLAAITDEISQDFEHALDVLQEYGATGAELRGLWGTNIADLTVDQAERAANALEDRGMRVVCLSTPFYKCDLSPHPGGDSASGAMHLAASVGIERQMDVLKHCIRLAHRFDTRYIRVFSFWRKEALTPDVEARIVEAFRAPLLLAESEDVLLLLENEHACFLGSGAETARVAAAIDSPNLGVVWDPGNAFFAGEQPFPEGYNAVKPWVRHVHIKDAVSTVNPDTGNAPRWCIVGEGEIDYIGQFAALRDDGYNGYISLETHYRPESGSAPDGRGTPEEGSRPCLAALSRMLNV